MKKRLLSTMLALCLVLTILPLNALATDEPPVETETGTEPQEEEPTTPENPTLITPTEVTMDGQTEVLDSGGTSELRNPPGDTANSQLSGSDSGNDQDEPMILSETEESARTSITDPGLTASGTCGADGDNVTWSLNTFTGVLTIGGSGEMKTFDCEGSAGPRDPAPWYYVNTSITTVVIQKGITTIGSGAFFDCPNLVNVTIPDSVESIGRLAFSDCISLNNIDIPNSVIDIAPFAFVECKSLDNVIIPESVTNIGNHAFEKCTGLIDVTTHGNIGSSAFLDCTSLVTAEISNDTSSIGNYAFCGCNSLKKVTLPQNITEIAYSTFGSCTSLKSIIIPDNVSTIHSAAFSGCTNLESVILSEKLSFFYDGAGTFSGCSNLKYIYVPKGIHYLNSSDFRECDNLTDIYFGGTQDEWNLVRKTWSKLEDGTIQIHYNSKPEDVPMPSEDDSKEVTKKLKFYTWTAGGKEREISWNWDLFTGSSTEYNNTLAKTGLILSAAAENSQGAAESELKKLGFQTVNSKNFDTEWFGTFQPGVTFGHKVATTSNGTRHIFAIVVRGTSSVADIRTDILSVYDRFNPKTRIIKTRINRY